MSNQQITKNLRAYQKQSRSDQVQGYLRQFEKRMLYRTTKTENPETTMAMVEKVLRKLAAKAS